MLTWKVDEQAYEWIGRLGPFRAFKIVPYKDTFRLVPLLPDTGVGYYTTMEKAKEEAERVLVWWLNLAGLKVVE